MKDYFINVWLGVFIKPKIAIEYALKNRSDIALAILLTFTLWYQPYGTFFIAMLEVADYINGTILNTIFFGLTYFLLYKIGQIFKSQATKLEILFVIVLINIVFIFLLVFEMICMFIIVSIFDIELSNLVLTLSIIIFLVFFFYIFIMLLNKVQKIAIYKSILVLLLTNIILVCMTLVSNYFLNEQRNLGIFIYEVMIDNTKVLSKKVDYHVSIAELLEDQKLYEDAITQYVIAVKLEDDNVSKSEHYYWIAEDYKKLGMDKEALIYAKKSLTLTPEDEDSLKQVSEFQAYDE